MVFIKKILIKGFKSYKDQTAFDTFHPRYNVIVGRNGSGKSNFFDAIRFVLCDERFSALRTPHERQGLLHVGGGDTVMSAYVEVYFDNTEGRFPTEKEEVVLRRNIGLKKDEYFLDRKHLSKAEVMSFLESAGFSRSNPYYIVQQGRISALTMMRDDERLELLKEVAGTRVYDTRREESLRIMAETSGKTERIDEVLGYIAQRLSELEDEQKELAEFEKLDKRRRALEYALFTREHAEYTEKVKLLDEDRVAESARAAELHAKEVAAHSDVREAEKRLKALLAEAAEKAKEKDAASEERQELIKKRAKIELEAKDAEERQNRERERARKAGEELESVNSQIEDAERRLAEVAPAFTAKAAEEDSTRATVAATERRIEELYAKQGRSAQFPTKEKRDKWLQKELESIRETLKQRRQQQKELRTESAAMKDKAAQEREQLDASEAGMGERRKLIEQLQKALGDLRAQRDELLGAKREQQRKAFEVDSRAQQLKRELQRCETQLEGTISRVLGQGLAAVKRIVQEKGIAGVHGPVIENLDVDPAYSTAVEVTAGNSLFYVIVDSDETAGVLLDELTRLKVGRVTFIPINRLVGSASALPETADSRPLMSQVRYRDPAFKPVVEHIFGKTLLCRSQEVAHKASKEHNCNCVTLDGDQVNRKGVWTGGFYDPRASRLDAMRAIKDLRNKLAENGDEARKAKQIIADLDQRIAQVLGELQRKETVHQQARDTYEQLVADMAAIGKELQAHSEVAEQRERAAAQVEAAVQQLAATEASMAAEIGTDLLSQLTRDEQAELKRLTGERDRLAPVLVALAGERAELESRRNEVQNALTTNLLKRRDELRELMGQIVVATQSSASARDLEEATKAVEEATVHASEMEQRIEELQRNARELRAGIEKLRADERNAEAEAAESARLLEQMIGRRSAAVQRRDDAAKKIHSLGSLPAEAISGPEAEERAGMSSKQLLRQLHEASDGLRAFSHVNKKARDQYVSFTDQRDQLNQRRTELTEAKASIEDLIQQLDRKKDEAIERTFKGVSKNFVEVFKELVPDGSATLVMLHPKDTEAAQSADDGEVVAAAESQSQSQKGRVHVEQFTGVSARVTFPGSVEQKQMHQLSGGQKSLVALALIFAIQRTDPAPFYLFDEVDSNLDATYRAAVAKLIRKQSKDAQFIVTTFRPELVTKARKWYGISYANKVSTINPISQEEALKVIHEEAGTAPQIGEEAEGAMPPPQAARAATEEEEEEAPSDVDDGGDDATKKRHLVEEQSEEEGAVEPITDEEGKDEEEAADEVGAPKTRKSRK